MANAAALPVRGTRLTGDKGGGRCRRADRHGGEGGTAQVEAPAWLGDVSRGRRPPARPDRRGHRAGDRRPATSSRATGSRPNASSGRSGSASTGSRFARRCRISSAPGSSAARSAAEAGPSWPSRPSSATCRGSPASPSRRAASVSRRAHVVLHAEQLPASTPCARGLELEAGAPVFEVGAAAPRQRHARRPRVLELPGGAVRRDAGRAARWLALRAAGRCATTPGPAGRSRPSSRSGPTAMRPSCSASAAGAPLLLVERVAFDAGGRPGRVRPGPVPRRPHPRGRLELRPARALKQVRPRTLRSDPRPRRALRAARTPAGSRRRRSRRARGPGGACASRTTT